GGYAAHGTRDPCAGDESLAQPGPGAVREAAYPFGTMLGAGGEVRPSPAPGGFGAASDWSTLLASAVAQELAAQLARDAVPEHSDLMQRFVREFEATVIRTALRHTRGRRIEAAQRLGIGRNTITRKIQDLGLDEG
ncbi:MAG: nitrogen regulation protein NR(I), partial [Burkholderiales bacterium]